jgi:hypothetical protein
MRWFCLVSVSLLAACGAAEVQTQKLKDGSYDVTCQLSMDECIRRVQDECRLQRYRILEGTSETRLRDAPPFEKAYHTSRLHLVCSDDGASPLLSFGKAAAEPSSAPASTCSPGETRTCVGAGACKGGQACLPDGKAFGPCDCGPPPGPAAMPPPPAAPPSDAPAVGAPPDAATPAPVGAPAPPPGVPVK